MIRRNFPLGSDDRKWLLISQVEHARVSCELATAWGSEEVESVVAPQRAEGPWLATRRQVLRAIERHDDGWASWEDAPGIDPEQGRPYGFTEMPHEAALALWRDSALCARQEGPLAGWLVAGHFLALLEHSEHSNEDSAIAWREATERLRRPWLEEWLGESTDLHTQDAADKALQWLRMFDWLSLWFCCSCPASAADQEDAAGSVENASLQLDCPGGEQVCLAATADSVNGAWTVTAAPWPFSTPALEIDALGYAVPARRYESPDQLASARSPHRLRWRIVPA